MIRRRHLALIAATGLAAAGCGGGSGSSGGAAASASAAADQRLADVCPATVVVQTDWNPEAEHGYLYQLVGKGYTVDTAKKKVTGPLVIGGKDTGVKIEVRTGGPAVGFQSVTSLLYLDKSITLGMVSTDGAVQNSRKQPVTAVVAPLRKNPMMVMWDPKKHPDWKTIADIGKSSGTRVLYNTGQPYADYFVAKGLLQKGQLDSSYDGTPATFVADSQKVAQQGFATAEPYIYEHEVRAFKRPVKYQLIADTGYDVYPQSLSARAADVKDAKSSACLKKLVPVLQQGQAGYAKAPDTANALIVDLVKQYNTGWAYSKGVADFAAKQMVDIGIIADEKGTLGGLDPARVSQAMKTVTPILVKSGKGVAPGLTVDDLMTTQFIDPKIGLSK